FYITTPIYYSSGDLHLGHCCTTVYADSLARYNRLKGKEVFFLTGSDEHGQKVAERAKAKNMSPKEYVDTLNKKYVDLWKMMDISYDKFIRTTDSYHEKAVQDIFQKLYDKGDIYLSTYEGWYCQSDESFFTDSQLVDGKCPDCGREVKKAKEEAYFFRLSKYADKLLEYYDSNPEFVKLDSTINEMKSFIKQGLNDLCVSRTSVEWGIKVPFNDKHTIYVWVDALPNYLTALGYLQDDDSLFKKFWPADLHLMAKEIARFHIIIWPAILMALDLPLPKHIHAHGWLTQSGAKMGKSLGNGFNPYVLCERYGVDAVRYFLLKDGPIMGDAPYDNETFLKLVNSDLVNDLANLLSRTSAMMVQNFEGVLPKHSCSYEQIDENLINETINMKAEVDKYMDKFEVHNALNEIWKVIRLANKYIEDTAPWTLKEQKERLGDVLHNLYFVLHSVSVILACFIPSTASKIMEALKNADKGLETISKEYNEKISGQKIEKTALYQRLDIQKEMEFLMAEKEEVKVEEKKEEVSNHKKEIEFDDFEKLELKVGKIVEAEKVENADKLLKFVVDYGTEKRTVVSGVAKHYEPSYMVGKQVICVMNLKPRKIKGIESQAMILYAYNEDESEFCFITPEKEITSGVEVG
ncbi:MAG: methionine--tRNA ligase, partial [Clostridiales bacterium]|nr:methionine--tRNA ligase [Candidatus Apopatousia equi]